MAGVLTDHQRRAAVCLGIARALGSHPVEVRCLNELLPVAPEVTLREIVAENENNIRLRRFRSGSGPEKTSVEQQ